MSYKIDTGKIMHVTLDKLKRHWITDWWFMLFGFLSARIKKWRVVIMDSIGVSGFYLGGARETLNLCCGRL